MSCSREPLHAALGVVHHDLRGRMLVLVGGLLDGGAAAGVPQAGFFLSWTDPTATRRSSITGSEEAVPLNHTASIRLSQGEARPTGRAQDSLRSSSL